MNRQALALACAVWLCVALPPAAGVGRARAAEAAPCAPADGFSFICGLANVEDMVQAPGTRWLIGSSMRQRRAAATPGPALYLIDTASKTAKAASFAIAPDKTGPFAGCAAPDPERMGSHGVELRPGKGGVHTLYVINHGREALEVFRVDARGAEPKLTWTGCLMIPDNAWANSVAALPGGALAISKFADLDKLDMAPVLRGETTGVTLIWTPGKGFSELPGARLSGNNGILASKDGKTFWISDQGRQRVVRFALDGRAAPVYAKLSFRPDNLRWAPDGTLLAAGQTIAADGALAASNGWGVARISPRTMVVTPVMTEAGRPEFSNGTVALQVGKTLWLGTFRGNRVAYTTVK